MAVTLLLSVEEAEVRFGPKVLFEGLTFHIQQGDKISLVGLNGSGKSTLMNIVTGVRELDDGKRWVMPGTTIGHLQQEVTTRPGQTVYDYVFEGLSEQSLAEGKDYLVEQVVAPLQLNIADKMENLSGGQARRASLARALIESPDILLLDEPTNHLDLEIIEWLENYLKNSRSAVLCISHDRTFLSNMSDKVFWLDRGKIKVNPKGFAHFDEWSTQLLEQEEREIQNRRKIVEQEVEWANRGVQGRRKRNVRRVELMKQERDRLRSDTFALARMLAKVEFSGSGDVPSRTNHVAEFHKVGKTYTQEGVEKKILHDFNLRIMKGDRIGIVGRNGSGKSTFLKMLVGELTPDTGRVRLARDLQVTYLDQKKELKPTLTLQEVLCPNGGDHVKVLGPKGFAMRHFRSYLKDFLFDPRDGDRPVGTLSGGQKNRLMLARAMANPGGLLVLDEPTNDLDMDTLDRLEDMLMAYKGTLIVVSHDRDFLDQTVSKMLAFEGNARVEAHIGGYHDYLRARAREEGRELKEDTPFKAEKKPEKKPAPAAEVPAEPARLTRLPYKVRFELEQLPKKIETLTEEIKAYEAQLADPGLYMREPDMFDRAMRRLERARVDLEAAETRWLELEELRVQSAGD